MSTKQAGFITTIMLLIAWPAAGQGDWTPPAGFVPSFAPAPPAAAAMTGPITFAEPEFPFLASVNGLTAASIGGVPLVAPLAFSFGPATATFSTGPGNTMYVSSPMIEGNAAGTLTLDFGADVTRVAFGFAQSCGAGNAVAATVTARDFGGGLVGSTMVAGVDAGFFFLENQVDFTPGSPFRTVDITFNPAMGLCRRFAVDNLAYDFVSVPALPAAGLALLFVTLLSAGLWLLKRRPGTEFPG